MNEANCETLLHLFLASKFSFYMKKTIVFALLSFLFAFASCKKNDQPTTPTTQNIAGVYRITAMKGQNAGGTLQDYSSQLTECNKTSTWGFQSDGNFFFGGAVTQTCQDGDYSGKWSLSGKALTLTANGSTDQFELVSFDGRNMVLSEVVAINGANVTLTITYTKI
jgi:Lipocalin-like domain